METDQLTLSRPLRPKMARASSELAGSRSNSRPMRAILSTCSALLLAITPLLSSKLSSRPTRTLPPMFMARVHSGICIRPPAQTDQLNSPTRFLAELYMNWRFSKVAPMPPRMPMTHCM